MKHIKDILLKSNDTLKKALTIIDKGTMRITIVVDDKNKLLGVLNDGDIRRAILNGDTLDSTIENIYQKNPVVSNVKDSKEEIIKKAIDNKVYQIPIVNDDNVLVDVEDLATLLINKNKRNKVVLRLVD